LSRSPDELLIAMAAVLEDQLAAARAFDGNALRAATDARLDLLFELDLLDKAEVAETLQDPDMVELVEQIRELDARLEPLLTAGSAIIEAVTPRAAGGSTYRPDGRLKGRNP
jgi:hypothetical protein